MDRRPQTLQTVLQRIGFHTETGEWILQLQIRLLRRGKPVPPRKQPPARGVKNPDTMSEILTLSLLNNR